MTTGRINQVAVIHRKHYTASSSVRDPRAEALLGPDFSTISSSDFRAAVPTSGLRREFRTFALDFFPVTEAGPPSAEKTFPLGLAYQSAEEKIINFSGYLPVHSAIIIILGASTGPLFSSFKLLLPLFGRLPIVFAFSCVILSLSLGERRVNEAR